MTKKRDVVNNVLNHCNVSTATRLFPATAGNDTPLWPDYTVHIYNAPLRRGLGSRSDNINA